MNEYFPITKEGYRKLQEEIGDIKEHIPQILIEIEQARAHGDLSENAEYTAALEKQQLLNRRVAELENYAAQTKIIDIKQIVAEDIVRFGATVTLLDLDTDKTVTYHLAGTYEVDLAKQIISIASPIGESILNKKLKDIVEVTTPKGNKSFEILKIEYLEF